MGFVDHQANRAALDQGITAGKAGEGGGFELTAALQPGRLATKAGAGGDWQCIRCQHQIALFVLDHAEAASVGGQMDAALKAALVQHLHQFIDGVQALIVEGGSPRSKQTFTIE